MKNTKEKEVKH